MHDDNLRQFESHMLLEWDLNNGTLPNLGPSSEKWVRNHLYLSEEYEKQYAFTKTYWSPSVATVWFKGFHQPAFLDATRIATDFTMIWPGLRNWKYFVDKEKDGTAQGLFKPEYSDAAWKSTDIAVDRFFTLGIPDYFGPIWYRQSVNIPAVPAGKKVYLWLTRTDGKAQVYVNGQLVRYVNEKGEASDESPAVYGNPLSFDITGAVRPGADNQITIKATRTFINELGTGGLLGPVYLYREK